MLSPADYIEIVDLSAASAASSAASSASSAAAAAAMGLGRKFGTVMWKNGVLKVRHWLVTTLEVLVPTILFIIVAILRNSIDSPEATTPAVVFEDSYK